ncbi:MAG: hypothetical protein ACD_23C00755G0001 [uncultured bacterium]|nr:MAG: hypothetical protein ACD_23C00755G0001 [uncultured bacterium]
MHGAMLLQGLGQAVHQGFAGTFTVVLAKLGPLLRLSSFQPANQVIGIQGTFSVILQGVADFPALGLQFGDDVGYEMLFLVCGIAHVISTPIVVQPFTRPRTPTIISFTAISETCSQLPCADWFLNSR